MGSWTAKRYLRDLVIVGAAVYGGWYLYQQKVSKPESDRLDCRAERRRIAADCRSDCEASDGHVSAVRNLAVQREQEGCVESCTNRQVNQQLPYCARDPGTSRRDEAP